MGIKYKPLTYITGQDSKTILRDRNWKINIPERHVEH